VIGNLALSAGWPNGSSADYVHLELLDPGYGSMLDGVRDSLLHKEFATPQDVETLERAAPNQGPPRPLYVVLPRQVIPYGEYFGWFPPTFVPSLIERLSASPGWTKVIDDDKTVVFAYTAVRK
jgi:hypothetical protein